MKKGVLVELQTMAIVLLVAFAEFAPVDEGIGQIVWTIAWMWSVFVAGIMIWGEVRNTNYLNDGIFVVAGSMLLYFAGYRSTAIIICCAVVILQSQIQFTQNSWERKKSEYLKLFHMRGTRYSNGDEEQIEVADIEVGNVLIVANGERIPVDGKVFFGSSTLDESLICGDINRKVSKGSFVYGGSLNEGDTLQVEATSKYDDSLVGQIFRDIGIFLESSRRFAQRLKRKILILKISVLVVALAVFMFPVILGDILYKDKMVAAACILVIGTVDTVEKIILYRYEKFGVKAFKRGSIYRDCKIIRKYDNITALAIEKREEFIDGTYEVVSIRTVKGRSKEELLVYAAHSEAKSEHQIAKAIKNAYKELLRYKKIKEEDAIRYDYIQKFEELSGMGVSSRIKGSFVCVGNSKLMRLLNINNLDEAVDDDKKNIYVSIDGVLAGYIVLRYTEKDTSDISEDLKKAGIKKYINIDLREDDVIQQLRNEMKVKEGVGFIAMGKIAQIWQNKADTKRDLGFSMNVKKTAKLLENVDVNLLSKDINKATDEITIGKAFLSSNRRLILSNALIKTVLYGVGIAMKMNIGTLFAIEILSYIAYIYKKI